MVCRICWDLGAGSGSAGCKCGVCEGLGGGLAECEHRGNSNPGGQSSWHRVKEVLLALAATPAQVGPGCWPGFCNCGAETAVVVGVLRSPGAGLLEPAALPPSRALLDFGCFWEEKGWLSSSEACLCPCLVAAGAQYLLGGSAASCVCFSWCWLGRYLVGAGSSGVSWARSRDTRGGPLVMQRHWGWGGVCLPSQHLLCQADLERGAGPGIGD